MDHFLVIARRHWAAITAFGELMTKSNLRGSAACQALALLGAGTIFSAPLSAQSNKTIPGTSTPPASLTTVAPGDPAAPAPTPGEEIVVTGSILRRTSVETPSPVTVLSSETLTRAGITNINDAIRSVSADSAGSIPTGFANGFSAGGAAVSLRGLGVSSTLVLIDGLRSTNFPLNDDGHNAYVDLNSIPFSAVERVEVLKDGASSTYGADAIGGVVNIIMKKHFTGVAGAFEAGASGRGDAGRQRASLTGGIGDYRERGWNFYINGEYQHDGTVFARDRDFPFNTLDLSSIGLLDQNKADDSFGTTSSQNVNAVVRRATQLDLNNPFLSANPTGTYTTLNLNCPGNTYTVAGASGGTGCKHDNQREFWEIQPKQERYSLSGRLSLRLSDAVEAYASASYSHSTVDISRIPLAVRQRQPYGASASLASNNPGVVLPVYICSAGMNCTTAADRRLNPNNPYAAAFAADPANGAARIYYLFGDIFNGSHRVNQVFRIATGLKGHFEGGWDWRIDGVYAKDKFRIDQFGVINIAGLKKAINTGAYNFVNPELNSQATRDLVAPGLSVPSHTSLASLDASVSKELFQLPGGPLQLAVGAQVRHEVEQNNSLNPNLDNYGNTSAAFGKHTVTAGYFEFDAPIRKEFEVNLSGRYDHYSEGFSHFSPKIGAKFTPIRQVALRGTYAKGFRAPTFAENNPLSSFAGFVTNTPPASFQLAHGGLNSAGNKNPYTQSYSVGSGFSGNPNLKPEKSRSFTAGGIFEPTRWLNFTVDYYNVKKTNVIVTGPLTGTARANYYAGLPLPAGYSISAVDAVDPLFPNALPRVLVVSAPYVNGATSKTSGIDIGAAVRVPLSHGVRFSSRVDVNKIIKYNVDNGDGVILRYSGTLGPYELSSGAGTPKWRGNWQNTLEIGRLSLTATTYYVSKIKAVAADEESPVNGQIDLSCAAAATLYDSRACYIRRFIYTDVNALIRVNDKFTFMMNVGNVTNAKAPVAPASYSGVNYLPTWHYAGVIGRTFRAGASFSF